MGEPTPFKRPINWAKIRMDEAEAIIRKRAAVTSNVIFGDHAFDRVEERSITQPDAYNILRTGNIEGAPQKNLEGEWEVVVVKRMSNYRDAGVVTIIFRSADLLFVKTVQWMDYTR